MIENEMTLEELNKEEKPKAKYGNEKIPVWICPEHHVFMPENTLGDWNAEGEKCGKCDAPLIRVVFDSGAEFYRYSELRFLLEELFIHSLRIHPKYMVFKQFVDAKGKRIRGIFYEADFEYKEPGKPGYTVEDVKGKETAVFKLKAKMFKKFIVDSGDEYRFVIVPAKDYS